MEYIGNYNLPQWAATDRVLREDFNETFEKINTALSEKGNCQLVTGSYTGTGTYGSSHKNTLTFEKLPLLVFVTGDRFMWAMRGGTGAHISWGNSGETVLTTWTENSLSWYADNVNVQMNISGTTYLYAALVPCN